MNVTDVKNFRDIVWFNHPHVLAEAVVCHYAHEISLLSNLKSIDNTYEEQIELQEVSSKPVEVSARSVQSTKGV